MRGRKPAPPAVKALKGRRKGHDSGGRPIAEGPKPELGTPAAPKDFSPAEKAAWKQFAGEIGGMAVLTVADRAALVTLCREWARMSVALAAMERSGGEVIDVNGQPQQNPWLKIYRDSMATVNKLLVEFGLTPSARSRIKLPTAEPKVDDLDALLK